MDAGGGKAKTICPHKGPLVRKLYECYASGEHSLRSLVDEAHTIGLKSFRGGRVTKTCVEWMLANPFYIGLIHIKTRNESYQGIHDPLIPASLFQRVQERKKGRSFKKITKHDNIYRCMFLCGKCSTTYCGERQKGHVYYRCHTKGCTRGTVREEVIDQAVGAALLGVEISEEQAKWVQSRLGQWGDRIQKIETNTSNAMQLGKVKRKQEQLLDAYLEGLINKTTFQERKAQFLIQETELSQTVETQLDSKQLQHHIGSLLELLKSLYLTYSMAKSAEKRQMLEILYSNRSITDKNVELEPKNWIKTATNLVTVLCGAHSYDKQGSSACQQYKDQN